MAGRARPARRRHPARAIPRSRRDGRSPATSTARWRSRPTAGIPATYVAHLLLERRRRPVADRFWVEAPGDGRTCPRRGTIYGVGEPIARSLVERPGRRWDWIGVYKRGADPNVASYLTWFYTHFDDPGFGTLDARLRARGRSRPAATASICWPTTATRSWRGTRLPVRRSFPFVIEFPHGCRTAPAAPALR